MLNTFEEKFEDINGLETDFVKLLSYNLKPGYSGTYKSHGYSRFCTILEGRKELIIDGKSLTYDKSQSLLLPPHSTVYMDIHEPTKAFVFEVNNELIQHVNTKIGGTSQVNSFEPPKEQVLNNLEMNIGDIIFQLINSVNNQESFIIDLYAQQLVYQLLKTPTTSKSLSIQISNPMDKAINYMHQNIDQPFSSQALAEIMNISPSNLSHSFKQHTGLSPVKYMHTLKMNRAKDLLLRLTVTETAFELGYETPSYFINVFKKHHGYTPKKYQQML